MGSVFFASVPSFLWYFTLFSYVPYFLPLLSLLMSHRTLSFFCCLALPLVSLALWAHLSVSHSWTDCPLKFISTLVLAHEQFTILVAAVSIMRLGTPLALEFN